MFSEPRNDLPSGVRTLSTITASRISTPFPALAAEDPRLNGAAIILSPASAGGSEGATW